MRNISEKFGREDQNPGGGGTHPPLGVRRWIFTLGICGLNFAIFMKNEYSKLIFINTVS